LISRAYRSGEVLSVEHDERGSTIKARVSAELAQELQDAADDR
jgi:hypothetical protein